MKQSAKGAIRPPILDYQRDTYLDRGTTGDGGAPAPVAPPAEDPHRRTEILDCGVGYGRWGISTAARSALAELDVDLLSRYPEPFHDRLLKPAILDYLGVPDLRPELLFLGHGSFNLNERVIHKFLRPSLMLGVGPQFAEIPSELVAAGGRYEALPLAPGSFGLPLDALDKALRAGGVSTVFIDNPNNPLGCAFPLDDLRRLARAAAAGGAVLLVDEAWGDFVQPDQSAFHLIGGQSNVIVVRSCSKALGLAAERVGYMAMSAELADYYRAVDVPFEPGLVGAVLAAATLRDKPYLQRVRREAQVVKRAVVEALSRVGVMVLPTHPEVSIMALHLPGRDLVRAFAERGVKVQSGISFNATHREWDHSYCRLRVVEEARSAELVARISTLG